jgi:hypothetical protein
MKFSLISMLTFLLFGTNLNVKSNIENANLNNNHFATFLGITTNTFNRNSDFTLGLDYEYILPALNHTLGFGLFTEFVNGENNEYTLGLPIYYHLDHSFKIMFAPGISMSKEEILEKNDITMLKELKTKNNTNFLIRIGAAYDFHISNVSFCPTLQIDYIESHFTLIYGLGFGISF